jgi:hypothetical protein
MERKQGRDGRRVRRGGMFPRRGTFVDLTRPDRVEYGVGLEVRAVFSSRQLKVKINIEKRSK